jgi:hypothetical protein
MLEALSLAGEKMDARIAAAGTGEEELVAEFEKACKARRECKDRS